MCVCARPDLCGGRRVTGGPTAIFLEFSYSVMRAFLTDLASGRGDAGYHDLSPAKLPDELPFLNFSDWTCILRDSRVCGDQGYALELGLGDQEAIKGISVDGRQRVYGDGVLAGHG